MLLVVYIYIWMPNSVIIIANLFETNLLSRNTGDRCLYYISHVRPQARRWQRRNMPILLRPAREVRLPPGLRGADSVFHVNAYKAGLLCPHTCKRDPCTIEETQTSERKEQDRRKDEDLSFTYCTTRLYDTSRRDTSCRFSIFLALAAILSRFQQKSLDIVETSL